MRISVYQVKDGYNWRYFSSKSTVGFVLVSKSKYKWMEEGGHAGKEMLEDTLWCKDCWSSGELQSIYQQVLMTRFCLGGKVSALHFPLDLHDDKKTFLLTTLACSVTSLAWCIVLFFHSYYSSTDYLNKVHLRHRCVMTALWIRSWTGYDEMVWTCGDDERRQTDVEDWIKNHKWREHREGRDQGGGARMELEKLQLLRCEHTGRG